MESGELGLQRLNVDHHGGGGDQRASERARAGFMIVNEQSQLREGVQAQKLQGALPLHKGKQGS